MLETSYTFKFGQELTGQIVEYFPDFIAIALLITEGCLTVSMLMLLVFCMVPGGLHYVFIIGHGHGDLLR